MGTDFISLQGVIILQYRRRITLKTESYISFLCRSPTSKHDVEERKQRRLINGLWVPAGVVYRIPISRAQGEGQKYQTRVALAASPADCKELSADPVVAI